MHEALFENLHVNHVFHNTMRNKKVEFNSLIYLYFIKIARFWPFDISVFNTQQGGIQNSCRLIRHGNGLIEELMSKIF